MASIRNSIISKINKNQNQNKDDTTEEKEERKYY